MPLIDDTPRRKPVGKVSNSSKPQEDLRKPVGRDLDVGGYKSANISTRYVPLKSIISQITGAHWTFDYYANVVDQDDETTSFSVNTDKVYQSYNKIASLDVRVQQALDPNYEVKKGEFRLGGSSIIVGGVKPNVNNVFVADIGDGRQGLFEIKSVETKTHLADSVFLIRYQLKDYVTKEIYDNLESKVIKTWYYSISDLMNERSPLLTSSDVHYRRELLKHLSVLIKLHLTSFYDTNMATLLMPDSFNYDMLMVSTVNDLYPPEYTRGLPSPISLNCEDGDFVRMTSIWDILLANKLDMMPMCDTKLYIRPASSFDTHAPYGSVAWSGADNVYYPVKDLPIVPVATDPDEIVEKVSIYPPHQDGTYILSQWFYTAHRQRMSELELLLWKYLNGEAINPPKILELCKEVFTWDAKSQFYYIPMLVILIQICINTGTTDV